LLVYTECEKKSFGSLTLSSVMSSPESHDCFTFNFSYVVSVGGSPKRCVEQTHNVPTIAFEVAATRIGTLISKQLVNWRISFLKSLTTI